MRDIVDDTLRLWRSTPFEWGQRDCLLSVGDYIAARGGRRISSRFRGRYSDEKGAMVHVEAYGGVAGLIDLTGLLRTDSPHRGDVVVMDTGCGQEVGALCTGSGIAARLERGVIEIDIRFVKIPHAWKIS